MSNDEMIVKLRNIIFSEIYRLEAEYDEEVEAEVFVNSEAFHELLQINKFVMKAIRKSEHYGWHNLRENPNDLPTDGDRVFFCVKHLPSVRDKNYFFGKYYERDARNGKKYNIFESDNGSAYLPSRYDEKISVIAWKYGEEFEDEE